MRDMVGCFSEHAIKLSETTCSSQVNHPHHHHHHHHHQSPPISHHLITPPSSSTPATQITVTSQYNIITTTNPHRHLLVTLTWSRNQIGHQSLTVTFGDNPSSATTFKLTTTTAASRLFRKKKGTRSLELPDSTRIELLWDLSEANYGSGVEPLDGFYLIILVDSEIGLMLGDLGGELLLSNRKVVMKSSSGNGGGSSPSSSSSMLVSRKEYYSSESLYTTKAKFSECGQVHEISIRCVGEKEGVKHPLLCVSVDGRVVVRVKRLQWNFRGNQTVFVDGLLVDLFWDVHGWFFGRQRHHGGGSASGAGGCAVFMFRRRSGIETRLWLQEEEKDSEGEKRRRQEKAGGILGGGGGAGDRDQFSLLIYASKTG